MANLLAKLSFAPIHATMLPVTTTRGMTSNRSFLAGRAIVLSAALALLTAVGAATAVNPTAVGIACVAAFASIAVTSAAARFAIVVAGGLLVFRSSDQLDASKLAYFVWVGISAAVAIARLAAEREHRYLADARILFIASAGLIERAKAAKPLQISGRVALGRREEHESPSVP